MHFRSADYSEWQTVQCHQSRYFLVYIVLRTVRNDFFSNSAYLSGNSVIIEIRMTRTGVGMQVRISRLVAAYLISTETWCKIEQIQMKIIK